MVTLRCWQPATATQGLLYIKKKKTFVFSFLKEKTSFFKKKSLFFISFLKKKQKFSF